MASHYFDGIFLWHDLIKPWFHTWKLFSQLALNTLNNGSFQLDAVGNALLLVKFLEHDLGEGAPTGRAEAKRGKPRVPPSCGIQERSHWRPSRPLSLTGRWSDRLCFTAAQNSITSASLTPTWLPHQLFSGLGWQKGRGSGGRCVSVSVSRNGQSLGFGLDMRTAPRNWPIGMFLSSLRLHSGCRSRPLVAAADLPPGSPEWSLR